MEIQNPFIPTFWPKEIQWFYKMLHSVLIGMFAETPKSLEIHYKY